MQFFLLLLHSNITEEYERISDSNSIELIKDLLEIDSGLFLEKLL